MKTSLSLFASMATLLVICIHQAHSAHFMQDGKEYDDKFYAMFSEKAPVKDIIKLAVSWNAERQLDHFKQMYHHINEKDESAEYAQEIVDAARISLQRSLDQVGFEKKISLEQYLLGTYQIQNGMKPEVEQDVLEALQKLEHFSRDEFERLLDEGEQEEVEWELEHLYHKIIPKKVQKVGIAVKLPKVEGSSVDGPQPADDSVSEKPTSEESVSAEPAVESQDSIQNQAPETQESEEPVLESSDSNDEPTQESPDSVEEVVSKPEPEEPVQEQKESVEEIIAEPNELEGEASEPKESEPEVESQKKMSQEV
ncbi:neurofilament medium polypeptide-like [Planococcus citri]|uniref:neurofilament medium polypeptide-like n=1 Tax=Planococcus citri TaxID=170843 RepID=UPI0031F7F97F